MGLRPHGPAPHKMRHIDRRDHWPCRQPEVRHTPSLAGVSPTGIFANAAGAIRQATATYDINVANNFFISNPQFSMSPGTLHACGTVGVNL